MADAKSKSKQKSDIKSKEAVSGVTFKCRLCEKQKPISEMKVVRRFRPVLFVCQNCEKSL
jgi:transcription elongation factor Elf1